MPNYVACVPRYCGFNDVMCQIWRAYQYAQACDRVLVVDARASSLADDLRHYMSYVGPSDAITPHISDEFLAFLNAQKCYPRKFAHQIEQLLKPPVIDWSRERARHAEPEQSDQIRTKLERLWHASVPYRGVQRIRRQIETYRFSRRSEPLVIHKAFGGGVDSLLALQLFRLNPAIESSIKQKLAVLDGEGSSYDAIHIRHTDYRSDYEPFLAQMRSKLAGRRVLVCSDNPKVKERARQILANSSVISIPQPYDTLDEDQHGLPVHYQWELSLSERRQRNIGLLADLVALAKSRDLYFTEVRKGNGPGYSGFSRLARELHSRPDILHAWAGV